MGERPAGGDSDLSLSDRCESFIASSVRGARAEGGVVGVSGGVDSSVVLALTARALGPEKTLAVMMPSASTPEQDMDDASTLCDLYAVPRVTFPIDLLTAEFPVLPNDDKKTVGNLKARIRMCILYLYANRMNRLVIGTSDKSELNLGYYTKYGDGGVDIEPIGGLYKSEVRALARSLGLPERISEKPSSPRLWSGQTAEGELGFSYEKIDSLFRLIDGNAHKGKPPVVFAP